MKLNKILSLIIVASLYSCAGYEKSKINKKNNKIYYSSSGFALIYEESLYKNKIINKKLNNDHLHVLHSSLRKNTTIKITNLNNSKTINLKIYKKANYPKIFNVVISKKIARLLELDLENPLVEITEIKKNKTFVAKDGNTFDEEKNVADKAPVDEIKMDDLTLKKDEEKDKKYKLNKFIIVISDFYYKESAIKLQKDLSKKMGLNNISIKKINDNKYRLLLGPFENFNALKTTYISLNDLGFEGLNVYNE